MDRLILIASFFVAVISSTVWSYLPEDMGQKVYFIGMGTAVLGYTYILKRKYKSIWTEIILAGTTNQLADELFFDPRKLGINEYATFGVVVIIILYQWRKKI